MVSVVMSVYNTKETYLRAAIDSILKQTFQKIEFLIFDDASDEKTKMVLGSYKDKRINIITNTKNYGLTHNLNVGLKIARGKYIVRMDADDVSDLGRIEKLVECMEKHHSINIMGSYAKCGETLAKYEGNIPYQIRKALLLLDNKGLAHPSVIMRKEFLDRYKIFYNESIKKAQDYELWTQCIFYTNLYVYPECLLYYRMHEEQISNKFTEEQEYYCLQIKRQQFERFKPVLSQEEIDNFITSRKKTSLRLAEYKKIEKKIKDSNKVKEFYLRQSLGYVLKENYIRYMKHNYRWLYRILGFWIKYLDIRYLKINVILLLCQYDRVNKYILGQMP